MTIRNGATVSISGASFTSGVASGPKAAGVAFVSQSTLTVVDSTLRGNRQVQQPAGAVESTSAGSGGIYSEHSKIAVERTALIDNAAASVLPTSFADQIFSQAPITIKALDVTYNPYVEAQSAMIQPGAVLGSLRGSCKEVDPCDAGNYCQYERYALSCTPCPGQTVSYDGLTCGPCPQGTGPTENRSSCAECAGSNHSTFGVCLPCSETLVVDADHK